MVSDDHLGVARVVEAALSQRAQHLVGTGEADVVAVTAGEVSERAGEERLADADGAEDDDVTMRFEEAQAHELREHALVEGDLRGLVPELQTHRRIEPPRRRGCRRRCCRAARSRR